MAATAFGLNIGDYEPQPNFRASRDAQGAYTASQSFKMLRTTWEGGVASQFAKGTRLTDLYPELSNKWEFLQLETRDLEEMAGGIVEVTGFFAGHDSAEYESDREVTYILSGTRIEAPIIFHPLYLKEMKEDDNSNHVAIVAAYHWGAWLFDETSPNTDTSRFFYDPHLLKANHVFSTVDSVKWARFILEDGNRTFMAPTLQWTVETSNLAGLTDDDINDLATESDPPGNPPTPFNGDHVWMLISCSDTRTQGSSTNSRTWELSPPQGFPKFDNGKSIYDYDLSELK